MFQQIDFTSPIELTNSAVITGDKIQVYNNIDLDIHSLEINTSSDLTGIYGNIIGENSILNKSGLGELRLSGQNTFSGETCVPTKN